MKTQVNETPKNATAQRRRFTAAGRILMLGFAAMLFALPASAQLAEEKQFSVSKDMHIDGASNPSNDTKAVWDFEANRYGHLKIKLTGRWRVMWFNNPSQKFTVKVNGKQAFKGELAGERTIDYTLDSLEYGKPIKVEVEMNLNGMANKASGNAEVICFEGQVGRFYIQKIEYDFAKKVELPAESRVNRAGEYSNDTPSVQTPSCEVTYTVTESAHWEKTFTNKFSIEFTAGYSPGSGGGPQWAIKLADQIENSWSEGGVTTVTTSTADKIPITIAPYTKVEIFYTKTEQPIRVPYTMTGYYLLPGGGQKPDVIKDTCIFSNTAKVTVSYRDVTDNGEGTVLRTYEIK